MRCTLILACLLLAPGLVAGESPAAASQEGVTELDRVVVVASKAARPIREVAGIVDVIERDDIDQQMARDFEELLRFTPSVSMDRDPNRFGSSSISIRGIGGNRVVTEIDGMPVPDGFAIGDFSNAGRDLVDPEIVKSIEVLRGPASALYGSDALGGVLAIRTLDPKDMVDADGGHAAAKAGYGSTDSSNHLAAYLARQGEMLDTLVLASHREGEELEVQNAEANPASFDSSSGMLKFVHYGDAGEATRLLLDFEQGNRKTDVQSLVYGPGRYSTTSRMEGDDDHRRLRAGLSSEMNLDAALAEQLRWTLYYHDSEIDQYTVQDRDPDARTPDPTRRERRFFYRQSAKGGELTLERELSGAVTQTLVYGVELTDTRTEEFRDASQTNLTTGATTDTVLGETFPLRDFPISDILEIGAYFQDEIEFAGGDWTLIPALRYEYYELDPREDAIYSADNPSTTVVSVTEEEFTPRLALVHQLGQADSLYLQYARGFRAPPFEDVNIGLDISAFNIRAIPNPELEPETSDSYEFGWRHDDGLLFAELGVFYTRLEKLIESRSFIGVDPATGTLLFQSVNRDEARLHGTEVRLGWRAGRAIPALEGWSFDFAGSLVRGVDTGEDRWLNSVDPDEAIAAAHYLAGESGRAGSWSLDFYLTMVARKERVDNSAGEVFIAPGYTLLDIYAAFWPVDALQIRAGLTNATDKHYWEWSDVRGLPADYELIPLYAKPGRGVRLEARWEF